MNVQEIKELTQLADELNQKLQPVVANIKAVKRYHKKKTPLTDEQRHDNNLIGSSKLPDALERLRDTLKHILLSEEEIAEAEKMLNGIMGKINKRKK